MAKDDHPVWLRYVEMAVTAVLAVAGLYFGWQQHELNQTLKIQALLELPHLHITLPTDTASALDFASEHINELSSIETLELEWLGDFHPQYSEEERFAIAENLHIVMDTVVRPRAKFTELSWLHSFQHGKRLAMTIAQQQYEEFSQGLCNSVNVRTVHDFKATVTYTFAGASRTESYVIRQLFLDTDSCSLAINQRAELVPLSEVADIEVVDQICSEYGYFDNTSQEGVRAIDIKEHIDAYKRSTIATFETLGQQCVQSNNSGSGITCEESQYDSIKAINRCMEF